MSTSDATKPSSQREKRMCCGKNATANAAASPIVNPRMDRADSTYSSRRRRSKIGSRGSNALTTLRMSAATVAGAPSVRTTNAIGLRCQTWNGT